MTICNEFRRITEPSIVRISGFFILGIGAFAGKKPINIGIKSPKALTAS